MTCGTADKRAFLLEAFPRLREDHIGDSRSCSFEETVKRQTAGKGVHLALNSLADDKLQVCIMSSRTNPALSETCRESELRLRGLCTQLWHCRLYTLQTGISHSPAGAMVTLKHW